MSNFGYAVEVMNRQFANNIPLRITCDTWKQSKGEDAGIWRDDSGVILHNLSENKEVRAMLPEEIAKLQNIDDKFYFESIEQSKAKRSVNWDIFGPERNPHRGK